MRTKPNDHEPLTLRPRCECECGCDAAADETDEGVYLCGDCADYYLDGDGQVVCSFKQDRTTCRHCDQRISWGPIRTGAAGCSNTRAGACDCGEWLEEEAGPGNNWRLYEPETQR